MKIAIDLRPLQVGHQDRGIGSYILNILKEIPTENIEYIILRYSKSDPVKDYSINFGKEYKDVVVVHNKFGRSPKELILYIKDLMFPVHNKLRMYRPNIYIQFDYLFGAPRLLNCKTYVVAYDLIPFKLKNLYLPSWKKFIYFRQLRIRSRLRQSVRAFFYEHKYRKALKFLRRANGVISISNSTTKDLIEIAKVKSKNINTIYLAASFRESEKDLFLRDIIKNLVDDIDGNFITFIGGTDKRRQVTELISA
ncbi:MAG: hypothetical protein QG570_745, partial [Patescibacteria group bacterium]|nr:hypothetical protein [Patescibacteria group bacterium]